MRVKVRTVAPPTDDTGLDELVAEPTPGQERPEDARMADGPRPAGGDVHLGTRRRPLAASDLGPNGDVVLDLLARAARLTPAECRALDGAAAWRWWMLTPLPGSGMPGARALALLRGRADGRAGALAALEAAVAGIAVGVGGAKAGRSRLRTAISNAGLAVLVRDLIEPDAFEILFGPWHEVMHD